MSELKEHIFCDIDEVFPRGYCGPLPSHEARPYYLKYEADKVIALLKDKALQYKVLDKEHCRDLNTQERFFAKQIAHNKYKRCLVTAKWCLTEKVYFHYRYDDWGDKGYDRSYKWKKVVFWSKWARRWLELAEKFKEAK